LSIEHTDREFAPAAHIGFEFDAPETLDAFVARLAACGYAIAEGPIDRSWLWREARLIDPDGHASLFFYAGANKLNPPWRAAPAP